MLFSNWQSMPGLDPVLLAVYSEHEGTELVEVTIMMMMIKMTIKMMTIMMTTSTMTKMMLMAVYSKLEGIELVEVTSSYFQATLDKPYWQAFRKHTLDKPYYQALQRSGASLRVLVSPGWLYRGPSVLEQVHNHLTYGNPSLENGRLSPKNGHIAGFTGGPLFLNRCTMQITWQMFTCVKEHTLHLPPNS